MKDEELLSGDRSMGKGVGCGFGGLEGDFDRNVYIYYEITFKQIIII